MSSLQSPSDRQPAEGASGHGSATWKLEDAKAKFSEIVRLAESGTPQHVSVRGRAAVVILSAADYTRLAPAAASPSLASLFADSPLARLDALDDVLVRERAPVRNAPIFEP